MTRDRHGTVKVPRKLIIVGAGGFGVEVAWVAEEMNAFAIREGMLPVFEILGFADDNASKREKAHYSYGVLGSADEIAEQYNGREIWYCCAIGNNRVRQRQVSSLGKLGWRPAAIVHPSAIVGPGVSIGAGTYVGPSSLLAPNASIGSHVIVNVHASVGHDSVLEDFVQVCPGSRISGCCRMACASFLGSNGVLLPGVQVGAYANVGAGSYAVRDVAPFSTCIAVPAVSYRKTPQQEVQE